MPALAMPGRARFIIDLPLVRITELRVLMSSSDKITWTACGCRNPRCRTSRGAFRRTSSRLSWAITTSVGTDAARAGEHRRRAGREIQYEGRLGRVLLNAGISGMSALGANRTCPDSGKQA